MKNVWITCVMSAFLLAGISGNGVAGSIGGISQEPVIFSAGRTVTPDVPYVPTPMSVVAAMLDMAGVDENDVVYDLGSGDGRIVITAAKERGARGVGIEIDPERIQQSLLNAERAGVSDRVEFLEQDLFETDLSRASVVTIYLLPQVNLALRPKLLRELKPGTRVVSHAFDMWEWEPDQSTLVEGDWIYYWVVPANVSGVWEWVDAGPDTAELYRLELAQTFQEVGGTFMVGDDPMPMENVKLEGDRLEFTVVQNVAGRYAPVRYEGYAQGDIIKGRRMTNSGTVAEWHARRDPETVADVEGSPSLIFSLRP
jgi:hypothetical protein